MSVRLFEDCLPLSEDCFRPSEDRFWLSENYLRSSEDCLLLSEDRLPLSEDRLRAFFCHFSPSSVLFSSILLFFIAFNGSLETDHLFPKGCDIFIYLRNK